MNPSGITTKWGIVGLSTIAALGEADVLVTDDGLGPEARATLAEHVGRLVIAGVDAQRDGALTG
jgi:DeoR/GlpR family transcriptional regulator of sugar metabolism